MSFDWSSMPSAREASRNALDAVREASDLIARQGSAGADYARTIGEDLLKRSREAGRTTRSLVQANPAQSLVLVAAAAFALGWLIRRVREREAEDPTPRRAPRARAPRRSS